MGAIDRMSISWDFELRHYPLFALFGDTETEDQRIIRHDVLVIDASFAFWNAGARPVTTEDGD